MFGPEYFNLIAYWPGNHEGGEWYGETLCKPCGEKRQLPEQDLVSEAQLGDFAAGNEYLHRDNFPTCEGRDGVNCDDCGADIVAPWYDSDCPDCRRASGQELEEEELEEDSIEEELENATN